MIHTLLKLHRTTKIEPIRLISVMTSHPRPPTNQPPRFRGSNFNNNNNSNNPRGAGFHSNGDRSSGFNLDRGPQSQGPAYHGGQRRYQSSSRRGTPRQQNQARANQPPPPPPEDPLKQYQFDDVTPAQIKTLDIFPQVVSDLVSPGKAVCYLTQIITVADNQFKNIGGIHFETKQVGGIWIGFMTINFPERRTFTCKHRNKKECKNLCSLAAIYHLRKNNTIDARLKLNIDTSVTNSFVDSSRGPVTVAQIPMSIKQQMMSFVSKFDGSVADLLEYRIQSVKDKYEHQETGGLEGKHSAILEGLEPDEGIVNPDPVDKPDMYVPGSGPVDLFTSRPFSLPDARRKQQAYEALKKVFTDKARKYHNDNNFFDTLQAQERLPIRAHKGVIVDALEDHRAIVVAGDTGSGKSTQVPQFILENFLCNESNINSFANIAITQPRRISAISLAERVSVELGEPSTGYTVGHNVRFDSKPPNRDLNIMTFFTTGMLLRKLQRNPDLKGVTHLIIDEVHERDCTTDFLLILVKRLLARRKDLRVVFMSASLDASLFAKYFDNCPVISVSGRCYPVTDRYLTDICQETRSRLPHDDTVRDRAPKLNLNLLTDLIKHIDETREQGAILCFMPGWKEMKGLQKELEFCRSRNKLKILLVHSKLPISEQRLIFSRPDHNERKVILATNIAETSITINDVCYVIDTGLCNSIDYDSELNMSTFGTRWISKANAKQRSGRAGRTCPGECFKLYSKEEEAYFQDFPFPELLRIPLESVIMEVKSHCPNEKAVTFLSQAIQHPTTSAIYNAIEELMLLGVLDTRENLTVLGRRISDFPTHPRLSVSLIVAAALRCLYPILNASAVLSSTQEPFLTAMTDKSQIRENKQRLCTEAVSSDRDPINFMSDHIAYGNLLAQYDTAAMSKHEHEFFIQENNLNRSALTNIQECRNLYAKMMISARFVSQYDWYSFDSLPNRNMNELELVIASLAHSFYPKIVRVVRGLLKGGRMYPNKVAPTEVQSNSKVRFASDSIVKNISLGKQLNSFVRDEMNDSDEDSDYISMADGSEEKKPSFLTYLNSRVDQESGQIVIRDGSVVPPLTLLLFGGRDITMYDARSNDSTDSNYVVVTLDRHNLLSFRICKDDATVIQEWRRVWISYMNWFIHTKNTSIAADSNDQIISGTMNDFLDLNKRMYASMK